MSGIGLGSVVNADLINRFLGLASGTTAQAVTSALKGNSTTISDGLRLGARQLGTAIQGLNAVISFVNVSHATLDNLGKLTDKMIDLAERATRVSTPAASRRDLDTEFRKLATDFQKIVKDAKIGTKEFLTEDGLTTIFQTIGLDPKTSDTIKALFKEFLTPANDTTLASEQVKGPRPVKVPRSSFHGAPSDTTYSMQKVTDAGVVVAGQATDQGSVFIAPDTILNQNPSYDSIFIKNTDGTVTSLKAGFLDRSFDKLDINESTGSTLIGTTQDLGGNAGHNYTAYLIDKNGNVTNNFGQFTAAGGFSVVSQHDFQISSDDSKISYIQEEDNSGLGFYRYNIKTKTTSSTNVVGTTGYQYSLGEPVQSFDTLKMSNDGSSFLYNQFDGSTGDYYTTSNVGSPWLTPSNGILNSYQFVDNNKFVFIDSGTGQVKSYTLGDPGSSADLTTGLSGISHLSTTQASSGNSGFFALDSDLGGGARRVSLYGLTSTTPLYTFDTTSAESISALSVGHNASNQAELGVLGNLGAHSGDTDTELYRFNNNAAHVTGAKTSRITDPSSALFADTTNLRTRPEAYRVLEDLKVLKEQIKTNTHALDDALDTVGKNLDFVRETGLAMLDLSNTIKTSDDAAFVAQQLKDKIARNASAALSQAANLNPIIVASLTLDSNSFK
jgi:hypothetical protein